MVPTLFSLCSILGACISFTTPSMVVANGRRDFQRFLREHNIKQANGQVNKSSESKEGSRICIMCNNIDDYAIVKNFCE
uniref:Uncharacterized protein n=1 Tax=Glossina palpalis gambiensis TaxID=67801 RepID=A0A1B0ANE4_9MUSC